MNSFKAKAKNHGNVNKQPRRNAPPFGSTQVRFQTTGLPVQESCTSRYTNLGPATYDLSKALKRKARNVVDWTLEIKKEKLNAGWSSSKAVGKTNNKFSMIFNICL